jgi:hypothetical protein
MRISMAFTSKTIHRIRCNVKPISCTPGWLSGTFAKERGVVHGSASQRTSIPRGSNSRQVAVLRHLVDVKHHAR